MTTILKDSGIKTFDSIALDSISSNGSKIEFNGDSSSNMAVFNNLGGVELYHNNVKKLETTSTGGILTGSLGIDIISYTVKTPAAASSSGTQLDNTTFQNIRGGSAGTDKYFLPFPPVVGTIMYLNNSFGHSTGAHRIFANNDGSSTYSINTQSDLEIGVNGDQYVKLVCISATSGRNNWIASGYGANGLQVTLT